MPIYVHQQKGRECEEMLVGGDNRPSLEEHTSAPLLLHWQRHGPTATKEAGKSFSYAPRRGKDFHGQLTLSVLQCHLLGKIKIREIP